VAVLAAAGRGGAKERESEAPIHSLATMHPSGSLPGCRNWTGSPALAVSTAPNASPFHKSLIMFRSPFAPKCALPRGYAANSEPRC
jgi:hypothetical protein